jgi:hypothetical protein
MIEGLWTGEWRSNVTNIGNHGAGTFLLANGKIYGGNTGHYYMGSYQQEGSGLKGEFCFQHYSGDPLGILGYSTDGVLIFKGDVQQNEIIITMQLKGLASVRLTGVLTKRMDIGDTLQSSLDLLDNLSDS